MNRWRYWLQRCPLHALLQLGQQEESPSQVLWRNNQPAFCFGLQINYYLNQGCIFKELFSRWPFTILICGGFFDKRYNSPIYRRWLHSLGTHSEGIFGVKRYNSPIYRDLLHSLGTRSALSLYLHGNHCKPSNRCRQSIRSRGTGGTRGVCLQTPKLAAQLQ